MSDKRAKQNNDEIAWSANSDAFKPSSSASFSILRPFLPLYTLAKSTIRTGCAGLWSSGCSCDEPLASTGAADDGIEAVADISAGGGYSFSTVNCLSLVSFFFSPPRAIGGAVSGLLHLRASERGYEPELQRRWTGRASSVLVLARGANIGLES